MCVPIILTQPWLLWKVRSILPMETKHYLDLDFYGVLVLVLASLIDTKSSSIPWWHFRNLLFRETAAPHTRISLGIFRELPRRMKSWTWALRDPVGQSGAMAHHPLRYHCSSQLPVGCSLNYRIRLGLKMNVRVTEMRTNGFFLRSLSNCEEEGLKKSTYWKKIKKL